MARSTGAPPPSRGAYNPRRLETVEQPAGPRRTPEVKRAKFIEIIEGRVAKVVTALDNLRPLSNREQYTFTHQDVDALFATLRREVDELEAIFHSPGSARRRVQIEWPD